MKSTHLLLITAFASYLFMSGLSPTRIAWASNIEFSNDGALKLTIFENEVRDLLTAELNRQASGYVVNSDSQTAYIDNFRAWLENGRIKVVFDYKAKNRGWTSVAGRRIYGPWVSDSGWISTEIQASVRQWQFQSYAPYQFVKWGSNNWFTNQLGSLFDIEISGKIYNGINSALAQAFGGSRKQDLRQIMLSYGPAKLAAAFGTDLESATSFLRSLLERVDGYLTITNSGFEIDLFVGYNFYFTNDCHKAVRLALRYKDPLQGWKTAGFWTFDPNQSANLASSGQRLLSRNSIFYFYAEIPGTGYAWTGDHNVSLGGRTIAMKQVDLELKQLKYRYQIGCSNLEE